MHGTAIMFYVYSVSAVDECSTLSAPANGDVSVPSREYQSEATYSCNMGYALNGDGVRTCEDGGVWSGTAPTCRGMQDLAVTCGVVQCIPYTFTLVLLFVELFIGSRVNI